MINNSGKTLPVFVFLLFVLIVAYLIASNPAGIYTPITKNLNEPEYSSDSDPDPLSEIRNSKEKIIRSRVMIGENFIEKDFYVGINVVAKQKIVNDQVVETTGEIPDGTYKFYDEYKQTHGEVNYQDGLKEGEEISYYENGAIGSKAYYHRGELRRMTEYYSDGKKRFEVDYSDAKEVGDPKERGIGKLYFQNGNIKYEWNVTKSVAQCFKRSHNMKGEVTLTVYLDDEGKPIKVPPPVVTQVDKPQ